jgi:Permuted papain-like amidase enzyme, YaeF/YiiX, C92 family
MVDQLEAGDIFFTRGYSLLSRAIRIFTRHAGESRTKVNHTGIVVVAGPIDSAVVVEALSTVQQHPLARRYATKRDEVAVVRPVGLSPVEIQTLVKTANDYVGRKYGFLKLAVHLADWLLQGAYVFRRLARQDKYPICSWLVAYSFDKVGRRFGVDPSGASPDDIWDWVTDHTDEYLVVRTLAPLSST